MQDRDSGGYFAAAERDDLLLRSKEIFDGAVPAANAVAVLNALGLATATGDDAWRADAELRAVDWPAAESWSAPGGTEIPVYRGTVEISGEVRPAGDDAEPRLLLTWQPCDDARCLPPVTRELELLESA